jgi:hypothetical protein
MSEQDYRLVNAEWTWKNGAGSGSGLIAVGSVPQELKDDPAFDERVFYYAFNDEELAELFFMGNGQDFIVDRLEN